MSAPELKHGEVDYPESDGMPMAETDGHRDLMLDLIAATRHHFRDVPDVYVSGNLFVYFVEGDPSGCVALPYGKSSPHARRFGKDRGKGTKSRRGRAARSRTAAGEARSTRWIGRGVTARIGCLHRSFADQVC